MAKIQAYWRQFAESVTDYANRYREDTFFQTEVNVIALQVAFTLLLIGGIWIAFAYLHESVLNTIVTSAHTSVPTKTLFAAIQDVQARNMTAVMLTILLMAGVFGYLLFRLTLMPTKNILDSQKQFVGNIAHELRTPLSIIKTNTEVALFDKSLDTEMEKMFHSNIEELDRISNIINNLLSLSTLIRPERIKFENVNLEVVIENVVIKLKTLMERKNILLSIQKTGSAVAWGNETALEQIYMNILKNAVTYTGEDGKIYITVGPDYRGYIEVTVQDTGEGIAQKDLFRVFEPFYRADKSRARAMGSSGLGLTIVSELIKLHHGKISIQSVVKEGTTVSVRIPSGKNNGNTSKENGENNPEFGEVTIDFSS